MELARKKKRKAVRLDTPRGIRIMGIDTGTAKIGFAVVEQVGARMVALAGRRLVTSPAKKKEKRKMRVSADDRRRLTEQLDVMHELFDRFQPDVIAVEWYQPNLGQSKGSKGISAGALKAYLSVGIFLGYAYARGVPVFEYRPDDLKKPLTGKLAASKDDVQNWVRANIENAGALLDADKAEKSREHVSDAFGHCVLGLRELAERRKEMGYGR
jgi:Holliday junction resolvasome RuvABC endonuclease subunit